MAQAGYSQAKPLKAKIIIAQGGTGQMLSLPMNEYIQQSLAEVSIQVEFQVVELENLYLHWRSGAKAEMNGGKAITAINLGYVTADPFYALTRFAYAKYIAPNGVNWGGYDNPQRQRSHRPDPRQLRHQGARQAAGLCAPADG